VTCEGTRKEAEKAIINKTIIVKEERLGTAFLPSALQHNLIHFGSPDRSMQRESRIALTTTNSQKKKQV
jgi:hypothetical protein